MYATFVSDGQLILVKHDDVYHTMHACVTTIGRKTVFDSKRDVSSNLSRRPRNLLACQILRKGEDMIQG